jgi:hypothetical protein
MDRTCSLIIPVVVLRSTTSEVARLPRSCVGKRCVIEGILKVGTICSSATRPLLVQYTYTQASYVPHIHVNHTHVN